MRADQEKERVDFKETKEDQKLMRDDFGKLKLLYLNISISIRFLLCLHGNSYML